MSLRDMQRDMRAWLLREDAGAARRFGEAGAAGLRVYQGNFRGALGACLDESFPLTRAWLGDEAFAATITAHIDRVPPSSWTLDAWPRDFPETLAALCPDDAEVGELAWIEMALGEAFVAADGVEVDRASLANLDWDRAILRFVPSLDLAPMRSNAAAIWAALEAGTPPPPAELLPEPSAIIVWRYNEVSRFRVIEADERDAVIRARAGLPFAALCEALVDDAGERDGVALAGQWLGQWLSDGLIAAIVEEDCR